MHGFSEYTSEEYTAVKRKGPNLTAQVTPLSRSFEDLIRQLVDREAAGDCSPAARFNAAQRVCLKLHRRLAQLVGEAGVDTLLDRALNLTKGGFPFLAQMGAPQARCFKDWRDAPGIRLGEAADALIAVLANLLMLLDALIGRNLTLRLLNELWPEVSVGATLKPKRK